MSAKHLTLIFLCSIAYLVNSFLLPVISEKKRLSKIGLDVVETIKSTKAIELQLKQLPVYDVRLLEIDIASPLLVSSWIVSAKNFGVSFSAVSGASQSRGTSTLNLSQTYTADELTGRLHTIMKISGSYVSLIDFKKFIEQEFSSENGILINELKLKDYQFEISASIFVREKS